MDLYNPHSLLDEAVEADDDWSCEQGEGDEASTIPDSNNDVMIPPLSTIMQSTPICPDDVDLEKIVVTGVLFVLAFFVLAPHRRTATTKRLKRRSDSKDRIHVLLPGSSPTTMTTKRTSHSSSSERSTTSSSSSLVYNNTLCTGMVLSAMEQEDEEEETEEEKFLILWPTIQSSPYRRLVLPPPCKRVDRPARLTLQQQKQQQQQQQKKDSAKQQGRGQQEQLDDDHPVKRLRRYGENFLDLIRSILSYEYWNAAVTVLRWLTMCIRTRRRHRQQLEEETTPEQQEDGDDDDDNMSRSSISRASITSSPVRSPQQGDSNAAADFVSPLQEEKKDTTHDLPYKRQESVEESVYDMPLNDVADNDVGEKSLLPPPSIPRLASQIRGGKQRDALESYRGGTATLHGALPLIGQTGVPLSPRMQPPAPLGVSFDISEDQISSHQRVADTSRPQQSTGTESEHSMSFFDAAYSRDSLKELAVAVPVPDKNGYILGDHFLPNSRFTPLLVFVNSRSGPQQGQILIIQLRRLLNPIQVWDLADGGPEKVLESFSVLTRLRILVCGGDGTVSWIISALEKMQLERWPPIAILPLGTGNDLARIHGWGGGYTNESLIVILEQIADAYISLLDRWEMTVENKKGKTTDAKAFTNYLGIGVDAQAALQVHMLRESMPKFFFSRFVNKAWYALFGAEDAIKATHANLPREVTLIADGVEVPLPADSQGIILLNIDSYAGGIPMWSNAVKPGGMRYVGREGDVSLRRSLSLNSVHNSSPKPVAMDRVDSLDDLTAMLSEEEKQARLTDCEMPSSCQDGMLDIVSIRGAFHLGQIRVGLSHAQRLCQCREATVVVKKRTAVHIDGEPWRQTGATLHIRRKKEPAIMLHRSHDESGGVETEMAKLLDWAEERQIIDRNVHSTLMKEFSRRIESKTRQRRVRSQENLMLSLSRALQHNKLPKTSNTFPNNISF